MYDVGHHHHIQYVRIRHNDANAYLDLANMLQSYAYEKAIEYYIKATKLLQSVTMQVYNNLGVLYNALGQHQEALKYLTLALGDGRSPVDVALEFARHVKEKEAVGERVDAQHLMNSVLISTLFNGARTYEYMNDRENAKAIYEAIVKVHPSYYECHLRLACMRIDAGEDSEAEQILRVVVQEINTECAEAWLILARIQMSRGEHKPAQSALEKVNKMTQNKDPYVWVSLGQLWQKMYSVINLHTEGGQQVDPQQLDTYRKLQAKALDAYRRALKLDSSNMYAANGIGCVLADKGYVQEAQQMFNQV